MSKCYIVIQDYSQSFKHEYEVSVVPRIGESIRFDGYTQQVIDVKHDPMGDVVFVTVGIGTKPSQ